MLYFMIILGCFIQSAYSVCSATQFDASGVCQPCNLLCKSCIGPSSSDCESCQTTRTIDSGAKTCNCNDGYKEHSPVQATCQQMVCDFKCATCKNVETFCKTCGANTFRTLVAGSGQCKCNSKYFEASNPACSPCHYTCQECLAGASTSCTSCNAVKFRITDGASGCKCMDKYYNSGTNEICVACNYKCLTCSGSATNCLTCGLNRATAPACACSDGFYDDGTSVACIACHYTCRTCTNQSSCAACDLATAFRELDSTTSYCTCTERYFESVTPNTLMCEACHQTCLKCTGSNSNAACTACLATANRQLSGTICVCRTGFYETSPTEQFCSACDARCRTCLNLATTCTTCSSALFRTPLGYTCPCMEGYYESPQTQLCVLCHSSCVTCTNGTQCASCDIAVKLYSLNSSNLCSCTNVTYFNTTQGKCIDCNIKCKTCSHTSSTFCTSCDTGRSLVSNDCPCLPLHYDPGASSTCSACHYSCLTCNGLTVTNCLTCSSPNLRDPVSGGRCNCKAGYYDNGLQALCLLCSYECATCVDPSTCATCDSALFRETPASKCPCKTGYFENSTSKCQKCAYHCITCTDANTCATCNGPNRVQNAINLKCECPVGFYDDGVSQTCFPCMSECKTCTNSSKCVSCQISLSRSLNTANRCPCITKYFDLAGTCTQCEYYCATCTAVTVCQTCNSTANRVLNPTSNLCVCKSGYFDAGDEECQKCTYACSQCTAAATHCTACDTTLRVFSNDWCECRPQFFDNNLTVICPQCHYSCATCTNFTHCVSCTPAKFRTFDPSNVRCACLVKYYDDGSNQLCQPCSYKCQACTNGTECHTCDATKFRITPASLCPCMTKYYDSGMNSETCLPCHHSCYTCTNNTECATCETINNYRTYNNVTKLCRCLNKFYDDGTNEMCLACVYSCATCQTTSSNCLTCADTTTRRELITNSCPCQKRFYDGNLDDVCQSCQYTCETCSDATTCDTCDNLKFRQHNVTDDVCHCVVGYFDDLTSNETCQRCDLSCVSCVNGVSCVTCDPVKKRLLNASAFYDGSVSSLCVCEYGLYSPGSGLTCLPCHYSCEVCSGPNLNNCLFCDSGAHRILSGTRCRCRNGYYDDGSLEICLSCHTNCPTCFGAAIDQCNSCINTKFFMSNQTKCYDTCPDYSFDNLTGMICSSCDSNCLHCLSQTNCTECDTGYHLLDSDRKCYTVCPDGFWENSALKICQKCPNGCKTCDSNLLCIDCIDRYYFDVAVNLCFSCHSTCKSCIGSAQDQCLSCFEPLHFKSNKCRNLTCPYGQYVDSVLGCKPCSDLFTNSLTCNKTQAFLCTATFKLKNGECKVCSEVEGYHITASTNTCSEVCGDGKLFDYQCDDGNQLDGDGCSKNCIIEEGWSCRASSSGLASVCRLESALSMTLNKLIKASGRNTVNLHFTLSLPYRLTNNFTVTADAILSTDLKWQHQQSQQNLLQVIVTIDYTKNLQGKNLQIFYNSNSNRRLQISQERVLLKTEAFENSQNRLMSVSSIAFNTALELTAFPPVDYYSSTEFQFFESAKTIIYYLALALLAVSLFIFPTKTHLHSFTFSFIVAKVWLMFGLALEDKLDWVNFVLQDIKGFALIGGVSMGDCCHKMSTFYEYSSELVGNSLWVILTWVAVWLFLGLIHFVNRFITKIPGLVQYSNYFGLTTHLVLSFHIFYASLNSLYHYSIENKIDAFNTSLSIAIILFSIILVASTWYLTSNSKSHRLNSQQHSNEQGTNSQGQNHNEKNINVSKVLDGSTSVLFKNNISFVSDHNQVQSHNQISQQAAYQTHDSYIPVTNEKNNRATPSISRSKFAPNFESFLQFDYVDLYSRERKTAKFFLPFTFTTLYVQAALIVFLAPYDKFYFIVVEGSIQLIYLVYILLQRPFNSRFTNARLFLMTLMFLAIQSVIGYYLYLARSAAYWRTGEVIMIYLIGVTLLLGVVFSVIEQIASWRQEFWGIIEPCLIYLRLRGVKKVHEAVPRLRTKENLRTVSQTPEEKISSTKTETQEYDAFYMRMIKKQKVNKKYRRERKMKQNIYSLY